MLVGVPLLGLNGAEVRRSFKNRPVSTMPNIAVLPRT